MKVTVVIPTHNRAFCLDRTLESVYNQNENIVKEIIIIDDASTDDTCSLVEEHQARNELPIKYLRNTISVGGAVARNQGAKEATGQYVAFLDSDDEWLPNHLVSKIAILNSSDAKGVYGTFIVSDNVGKKERKFKDKPTSMNMANYILSGLGDTRTSTFVFEKAVFDQVKFDESLSKHQDWDLAIRFDIRYKLVLDKNPTVVIHNNVSNRMSNTNNHKASGLFFKKHGDIMNDESIAKFYTFLAINTLRFEGRNSSFRTYMQKARDHCSITNTSVYLKLCVLSIPFINFLAVHDNLKKK